jgi:molybdopterin molybdotransferase
LEDENMTKFFGVKPMKKEINYISVKDALERTFAASDLEPDFETVFIDAAYKRALAEKITSTVNIPSSKSTDRDGYAVKSEDTYNASIEHPIFLKVVGKAFPGEKPKQKLMSGEACYIATGAFLPEGTDTVIQVEDVTVIGYRKVRVDRTFPPGEHVIVVGEDIKKGELLLEKSHVLRAQDIGLLAMLGRRRIKVTKRPTVAILSVGDELTNNMEDTKLGKVYASHNLIISGLVSEIGGVPLELGVVPDDIMKIRDKIKEGLRKAKIVLTIGGSSVGEKDFVSKAIKQIEEQGIVFHGIKRGPGRVTGLGVIKGRPIVMLPGLCNSMIVGFHAFALPLIRALNGLPSKNSWCTVKAKLNRKIVVKVPKSSEKVIFVELSKTKEGLLADPFEGRSALISVLLRANGFLITQKDKLTVDKGAAVDVHLIPGFSN